MLILGISANFVLDFVHVALKGIIINAEVSSLKTSFSYEASLLLLAPYAPRVIAPSPRSYGGTSLLCCNIFVIRTMTTTTAKSKVKSPKNSIPKKEPHSLYCPRLPHVTPSPRREITLSQHDVSLFPPVSRQPPEATLPRPRRPQQLCSWSQLPLQQLAKNSFATVYIRDANFGVTSDLRYGAAL